MTTQAGREKKQRDFPASCVADAYTTPDIVPGVDLRRGDCLPAHAMMP